MSLIYQLNLNIKSLIKHSLIKCLHHFKESYSVERAVSHRGKIICIQRMQHDETSSNTSYPASPCIPLEQSLLGELWAPTCRCCATGYSVGVTCLPKIRSHSQNKEYFNRHKQTSTSSPQTQIKLNKKITPNSPPPLLAGIEYPLKNTALQVLEASWLIFFYIG